MISGWAHPKYITFLVTPTQSSQGGSWRCPRKPKPVVVSAHPPQSHRNWLQLSMAPMGISQCGLGRASRSVAPQPPPALGQVSLEAEESPVPDSGHWRSSLQSWGIPLAGLCCGMLLEEAQKDSGWWRTPLVPQDQGKVRAGTNSPGMKCGNRQDHNVECAWSVVLMLLGGSEVWPMTSCGYRIHSFISVDFPSGAHEGHGNTDLGKAILKEPAE